MPILLLAQEISAKVLVDDYQLPGLEKVVDLGAANNITKLEALSTCINCITQECWMIDRSPWQLEKASVISNLRIGAAIPLRCIPCSSPKMVGLMVSGYKPAKQKAEKVGKSRHQWCDLGLCGDRVHRSIEMHCPALHQPRIQVKNSF